MWKLLSNTLPDFTIWIQAIVVFLVPFLISRVFSWIRTFEDE